MADNEIVKSKRDAHIERLRNKYPDKTFEDDEEIFGQISDDYDKYDEEIGAMKGREEALNNMLKKDERGARLLTDLARGNDPVIGLVKHYGVEIKDVLDDPDKQEEIAEANKEYMERVAKSRALDDEYEKNLGETLETLRQYQTERQMSDEQIDAVVDALLVIVRDGVMGKFSKETLDMMCNAINYDADVTAANREGEVAGRNAKIEEKLRQANYGDGTAMLAGSNNSPGSKAGKNSIFALAAEAD